MLVVKSCNANKKPVQGCLHLLKYFTIKWNVCKLAVAQHFSCENHRTNFTDKLRGLINICWKYRSNGIAVSRFVRCSVFIGISPSILRSTLALRLIGRDTRPGTISTQPNNNWVSVWKKKKKETKENKGEKREKYDRQDKSSASIEIVASRSWSVR